MVNFLSSFLPNLRRLLIPIYDLQKKSKKFKWTDKVKKAFNDIKEILISPAVLKASMPDGLFCLESNISWEGVGGTLLQKQGNEWVVISYHSKGLPQSAKNFGVTELELTGLLVNIHGFMQLLHNRYFEVLVDHKTIEYMIKSKTESPITRLKTLLLKLSEYTIDLKYQKGSEMQTSDALSRLQNIVDMPDNKDVIPLNFLQHFTPNYTGHAYSHLVENLYVHKTKSFDTTQVKRKRGRPPKVKPENPNSNPNPTTAATTHTTQPCKAIKIPSKDIASRELLRKINAEHEKSGRLTVARLNTTSKSKIMTEKYLLLPINPQQLTPVQTALQRMSEKHPHFEIQVVNPLDPQILNIQRHLNHWYQLILNYQSLENTFLDNLTLTKCKKHRNMSDMWTRITNPGTGSHKSLSNINAFPRHSSLHNRLKITIWHQSTKLYSC